MGSISSTIFKVGFGVALGVGGCVAWWFHVAEEHEKQGFRRGWVPIETTARPAPGTTPAPKKTAPAAPAANPALNPAQPKPAPGKTAPTPPQKTTAAAATAAAKTRFFKRLATETWRWPATVKIKANTNIRFDDPRGGTITFFLKAGAPLRPVKMNVGETYCHLFVHAKGSPFTFPIRLDAADTDLAATAKPEGTPKPPPPPPPVRRPPPPKKDKPAKDAPAPATSPTPAPAKSDAPSFSLPVPPPPADNEPAPTLFGVPIR
jgi:hypothetical protein